MKYSFWIKATLFFLVSAITVFVLTIFLGAFDMSDASESDNSQTVNADFPNYSTVIIDAGHGGEDGGASSAAGLVEKDVNLEIAKILSDMLEANGIDVIMTREDDRLLYDRNTNYQGRKKKLDLAARLAIADSTENAIFVSVHMNSFTDSHYSGLQVWYSPNNSDSSLLAELIQVENREKLQPYNTRKTKAATSAINILHNAKCPAVLVECGFLSNPAEAKKLSDVTYRQNLSQLICDAIVGYVNS